MASHQWGRGGRTFESRSQSVSNANSWCWPCPACRDAIFPRCLDPDGRKFTTLFLFNEKMLHLVDDIFWHLGFKSAEHADKVMSQIINYCDYCNYCDYFYYFRLESIMASLRAYGWLNATPSPKRFVSWVQVTVRFCVMAGFTTSRRKMLLADRGRVLGGSKPLSEWRLLCMMKRRFCCDMPSGKAAITKMCHCSMRRLLEMKQTNQLAACSEIE